MVAFVLRRVIVSLFVLLVASFLVYVLVAISGNPLAYLATDQSPNKAEKIALATERLHLDESVPVRYFHWLRGVVGCAIPGSGCDLGMTKDGQQVSDLLGQAIGATLRLVLAATVLAIVLGVSIGIVSALRQYSGFDYTITFSAFLFFSLPLFWVAVLLKQFVAIRFNNWLSDPRVGTVTLVVLSLLAALTWQAIIGGNRRRRLVVAGVTFVISAAILYAISVSAWFAHPAFGIDVVSLLSLGSALVVTQLTAGWQRRNVLDATLVTAVLGVISSFLVRPLLEDPTWGVILLLLLVAIAVGAGVGYLMGGLDRPQAARACAATAALTGLWIFIDHALNAVPAYSDAVSGRLIATIGSNTPELRGHVLGDVPRLGRPPDPADHRDRADLVRDVHSVHALHDAGDDERGLRPHGPGQGPDRADRGRAARLPQRADPDDHAHGLRLRAGDLRRCHHRDGVRVAGDGRMFVTRPAELDPNPVMGLLVVVTVTIVIFNMIADITLRVPRPPDPVVMSADQLPTGGQDSRASVVDQAGAELPLLPEPDVPSDDLGASA